MQATETKVNVNNEELTVYKINPDSNGNPRYVIHFLDLGIELSDYGKIPSLTKYRAKWFGGGYVFKSYNVRVYLEYMIGKVKEYYQTYAVKALLHAERYGIIDYEVKGTTMEWYEEFPMEQATYRRTLDLTTMQEERKEVTK